ncbi:MAG: hypothetical protein QM783_15360 [Phycisphaerales bacterium]
MSREVIFAVSAVAAGMLAASCTRPTAVATKTPTKASTTPSARAKPKLGQTTATRGYKKMNAASRVIPVGDLAMIDLGEDGEVAVMLMENGKIVMDLPAGGELSSGSRHVISADGDYAAVLYGVMVSDKPYVAVDSFAIVDGRKGTVTRVGGSWAAADTAWRALTGSALSLPKSCRGTGGLPPLPAPSTPPKRFDSWGHVP